MKQRSWSQFFWLMAGFVIAGAILSPVISLLWNNRPNQPAMNEGTIKMMNARFTVIQPQGAAVMMLPGTHSTWRSMPSQILTVGSTFKLHDRHWSADYKIIRIENDGVVVDYKYHGAYKNTSGQVKLLWKYKN